ncbi:MAG: hypothetical protein AAF555_12080 [Verrucomicrobiota bacterium]
MFDWAKDVIENGTIYFTNIEEFILDTHPDRGDADEGRQILNRNDVRCTAEYAGPVFVWCCTLDTDPHRVIRTWPDKNCVVQILDTVEFSRRITTALGQRKPKLCPLHVGPVSYTKTGGGYEQTESFRRIRVMTDRKNLDLLSKANWATSS